ncbi:zinc finger MYM-type protein 1-like [Bufo bufo]|uniref:zinc finger MYM-type protein 1-like n=1 Tax=Bufo bufo TaxID=8384 RepID=UPI001ABED50E|nr:zinc finger MYM-type protein 1-like [Bufo bufo]
MNRDQDQELAGQQAPPTKKHKSGSQKRKEKQILEDKIKKLASIDRFFKKSTPKESSICSTSESDIQPSVTTSQEACSSIGEVSELVVDPPDQPTVSCNSGPLPELSDDPAEWPDVITNLLRCQAIKRGPKQVKLEDFPLTDFPDGTKRRFSSGHYYRLLGSGKKDPRDWLIYSVLGDSVYCFCCRLFDNEAKSNFSSPYGFKDWKHVSGKGSLHSHEISSSHLSNYAKWKDLESSIKKETTIDKDLRRQLHMEEQRWRKVLLRLLQIIRWMAKNNLPFRGSSDTVFTEHNGIFLQLLELISEFDLVLKEHLQRAKEGTNAHYLSKDMQNKFLRLIADAVIEIIIKKVRQAKYFSIIVDCTPDISKQEQLSLVLRYVDIDDVSKTVEVKESFLEFLAVTDTTGKGLASVVLERLTEQHGLCVSNIRGQWEVASQHLSHLTLKALSQTRWCARLESVKAILLQFPQLVDALEVFLHGQPN